MNSTASFVSDNTDFSKGKVPSVVLRLAMPAVIAQLINVLYNIVDRIYIGHLPGVGELSLTGIGIVAPVIAIISAFGAFCGTGGNPLCAIARGAKDINKAEKILANTFTMTVFFAVLLTILGYIFIEPVLYLFGASENTFPYAYNYATIYLAGTIFALITVSMNSFITSQGFPKIGMLTTVIGAVTNIILDPIFIFVFNMGTSGAALATIIAQAVSAIWIMLFLTGKTAILDFKIKNLIPDFKIIAQISKLGVIGLVMQATGSVVLITINTQLSQYGGDSYIGAMTVINSVKEFANIAISSFGAGASPVLSYNYGAREYGRVKQCIRFMLFAELAFNLFVTLLILLIPGPLTRIFNSDPHFVEITIPAMRVYFCCFVFMSFQLTGQMTFQSLGMARYAVPFSIFRKIVIVFPLTVLLPRLATFGVMGVFWAEPISDIIGGLASFTTMMFVVYNKIGKKELNRNNKGE